MVSLDRYDNYNFVERVLELFKEAGYSKEQLLQFKLGMKDGLNIMPFADTRYTWEQMREIRLGLKHKLDVKVYAKTNYGIEKMRSERRVLCEAAGIAFAE